MTPEELLEAIADTANKNMHPSLDARFGKVEVGEFDKLQLVVGEYIIVVEKFKKTKENGKTIV